jgi:hypothetical protein
MPFQEGARALSSKLAPADVRDPGDGAPPAWSGVRKSPRAALESLLRFDCVRLSRLFETIQAAVLYSLLVLFAGAALDRAFERFYPVQRGGGGSGPERLTRAQFWKTLPLVLAQVALSSLAVFYVRHLVNLVPFLNLCPSTYISGLGVTEVMTGELSVAMVFVGVQTNLLRQMELLRNYLTG